MLVGWAIALTPHTGTVLTALRMALVHDPARGPFGAVPAQVRIDRGLEFAADAVSDVLASLCVVTHRLPAYAAHRKGKVERIHRTIDSTLLCGLPGFTGGPRNVAGRLYGPVDDRAIVRSAVRGTAAEPMRIERLAERFAAWVNWYNTERPHEGLDGRTPLQAWEDDGSALQRISGAKLRHLLLAGDERTIGKDGVHLRGLAYMWRQSSRAAVARKYMSGICRTMIGPSRSTSVAPTCVPHILRVSSAPNRLSNSERTPARKPRDWPPSGAEPLPGPVLSSPL